MSNEVYANMMEVSCKSAGGKAIAAFPDVCFTPPQTPATPPGVPIPYPNNGMASDCTDGSSTVKISGAEVMLKNKSYFKQSSGDEAGAAPNKGVVTAQNRGKVYFAMWSMDVKMEGENVVRHLDITTHNCASDPPNAPPWAYMDALSPGATKECVEQAEKTKECVKKHVKSNTHQDKRKEFRTPGSTQVAAVKSDANVNWDGLLEADAGKGEFYNKTGATKDMCEDEECKDQFECGLLPFDFGCCGDKTPHHVVPAHCFMPAGVRGEGGDARYPGCEKYEDTKAPCICLDGATKSSKGANGDLLEHGRVHDIVDPIEDAKMDKKITIGPRGGKTVESKPGTWNFNEANEAGSKAVADVKMECDRECLKKQCEAAHKKMGLDASENLKLRADPWGGASKAHPEFVPGGGAVSAPFGG